MLFDLLEFDGEDLRRLPIEACNAGSAQLLRGPHPGIAFNEHYAGDGDIVYRQACKLCCGRRNNRAITPTLDELRGASILVPASNATFGRCTNIYLSGPIRDYEWPCSAFKGVVRPCNTLCCTASNTSFTRVQNQRMTGSFIRRAEAVIVLLNRTSANGGSLTISR